MRRLTAPNKVLELLAKERNLNKYRIAQKTKLSYSRIHESIERLEKDGLIKGEVVGKTTTGLDKKEYSLTLRGFTTLTSLYCYPWTRKGKSERNLDILMENYKSILPLIAGKWNFLKQKGLAQKIYSVLPFSRDNDVEKYTKRCFTDFFTDISDDPKTLLKVIKAFSEDPDLRRVAREEIKTLLKWTRSMSAPLEKSIRILETHAPEKEREKEKEEVKSK